MIVAKYQIEYVDFLKSNHYKAWLEDENGRRVGRTCSGCSIGFHWWTDQNFKSCRRIARRHAKRLLKQYHKSESTKSDPRYDVQTLGSIPSYNDLQNRIDQLERELEIDSLGV